MGRSFDPGSTRLAALLNHPSSGGPQEATISERFDCSRVSEAPSYSVARRVFSGGGSPCMEDEGAYGSKTDSANTCLMVPPICLTSRARIQEDRESTTSCDSAGIDPLPEWCMQAPRSSSWS